MNEDVYKTSYDNDVVDIDETILSADVKWNPEFFLMMTVQKLTNALSNPDLKVGRIQFSMLLQWLEVQMIAKNSLNRETYDADVMKSLESDAEWQIADPDRRGYIRDMKRAEILLKGIYRSRPVTDSMRL
jgi:hypothetical protein